MRSGIIVPILLGAVFGAGAVAKIEGDRLRETERTSEKYFALFQMMNQWVKVKQAGKNLSSYLEKNGYKRIAIYGMSYVGENLIDELKGSNTTVAYGIDKRADSIYADVGIVSMGDELAEVDAVVVTAITFFDEIKKELSEKFDCPIISLEDILYEV